MNAHRHAWVATAFLVALAACGEEKAETQRPMMGEGMGEGMGQEMGEQMGPGMGQPMGGQPEAAAPGGGKPTAMPAELPEGVTAAMIAEGQQIFAGPGICFTCHGQDGKGVPNLGADLTDAEWIQGDGSYDGIVSTVLNGVPAEKSTTGTPMPPRGGSMITDAQAKAVAAYVWSLSHGGS